MQIFLIGETIDLTRDYLEHVVDEDRSMATDILIRDG
jgi:hypothetical protein